MEHVHFQEDMSMAEQSGPWTDLDNSGPPIMRLQGNE